MDKSVLGNISESIVPKNYLSSALDTRKSREKEFRILLEQRKVPNTGWKDSQIEEFINYLSSLDSNNFPSKSGLGEREARIACGLVARRHYNFGHGIGRSGDLLEPQPKAAGSTLMSNLTNALLLDLIHTFGVRSAKCCFLVPMATGMTLNLCLLTLRKKRPNSKYILWSRIDQKACFKSITTAGFIPIVIEQVPVGENLCTDIGKFVAQIKELGADNILCIFSTSSCFAPRNCDDLEALAKLAQEHDIPHLVNNAYGLQSTFLTHQIEQAQRHGRIDFFVQSTDKNLLVPVGGAIVAGFEKEIVQEVARTYAGRASSSQSLDVLMTILSLGRDGFLKLMAERKSNFDYLKAELAKVATKHGEVVLVSKRNPISIALTLEQLSSNDATKLGAMLFARGVSGARVVTTWDVKSIDGQRLEGWGSHQTKESVPYLTLAAALGITSDEIDVSLKKLLKCLEALARNKDGTEVKD